MAIVLLSIATILTLALNECSRIYFKLCFLYKISFEEQICMRLTSKFLIFGSIHTFRLF